MDNLKESKGVLSSHLLNDTSAINPNCPNVTEVEYID